MKLNQSIQSKGSKRSKGMTLLELTVVILVLLSLITILFVGARAWKKGSDRSANIMNIRNCQQAMRGYQNMYEKKPGDAFTEDQLTDYVKMPVAPNSDLTYTAGTEITEIGTLWLDVTDDDGGYTPDTTLTADW